MSKNKFFFYWLVLYMNESLSPMSKEVDEVFAVRIWCTNCSGAQRRINKLVLPQRAAAGTISLHLFAF
jgi:hypothetical protein